MSSTAFNLDLFSNITSKVRLIEFLVLELTVGLSYLCMDSFVKLYTRRYDCNKYLNPLLKGISYGQWVQTGYFSVLHGAFIADTMRFIMGAFKEVPSWTTCGSDVHKFCVPMKDVLLNCDQNRTTEFRNTSVFFYYMKYFTYNGNRNVTTSRVFVTAIAWILSFLVSSVTDETITKIFKITNAFTMISTVITITLLYRECAFFTTFMDIVDLSAESTWDLSMQHMAYSYGIGFLGIYDYGAISPFTMIDTASILFVIFFTISTFMRSFIIKILYQRMKRCVIIEDSYVITTHNLLYAVLPSTTEFFSVNKLFLLFILGNLAVTLMSFETFLISTMSKFLQYEFRNVKQIYIVGMVCAAGFTITVIHIGVSVLYGKRHYLNAGEREVGLDVLVLYLGGFRVAVIMWVYGVKIFATDIFFWLGFHPAKFWTLSWTVLPLVLIGFFINKCLWLLQMQLASIRDLVFIISTIVFVTCFQVKAVAGYLIRNNIVGIFRANKQYGPPDSDDRKRRQSYNEVTRRRKCVHNCMIIDEWFSCDHALDDNSSTQKASKQHLLTTIKQPVDNNEVQP